MATRMTITDPDWALEAIIEGWMDDEPEDVARECADTEVAWLINHTHEYLPGWSYSDDGSFSGPPIDGALGAIQGLFVEAADFAVAHLDEAREAVGL